MKSFRTLSPQGWRRTAVMNIIMAFVCVTILLIILSISVSQPGSSLSRPTVIFKGDCTSSGRLNLVLNLLVNILSGVVLASSNFFMQVLSSPSREEIDIAHSWLRSLDIGVPSVKNLYYVARFKSFSWLMFLISSVPIHLFFNSAIFSTSYLASQWHLTIATEAFTKGATYFPPGASLTPAGSAGPAYRWNESYQYYAQPGEPNATVSRYYHGRLVNGYNKDHPLYRFAVQGYGETVPMNQYSDKTSVTRQNISTTAKEAQSWVLLDANQCQTEYMSCNPRARYADVVVVIDNNEDIGWLRSQVFGFDATSDLASHWDNIVPPNQANSLWFSAQCSTSRVPRKRSTLCTNTCSGALGQVLSVALPPGKMPVQEPWLIPFFPDLRPGNTSLFGHDVRYNNSMSTLKVSHCLAQPAIESCQIGVANGFLLVAIICVFIKTAQGAIVIWKLPCESLVTPGDAIQSFILQPDPITRGLGGLGIEDSHRIEVGDLFLKTTIQHYILTQCIIVV